MPLVTNADSNLGTLTPPTSEPMLGVMTRENPPLYMPIPPGAHLGIITDPAHPDTMTRWVLVSVSKNGKVLKLRCDCTVPGCTRTAQYTASYKGVHPSRER